MPHTWLIFVVPLALFGVATFLATWWLRGRGFAEFRKRGRKGPPGV
jgi:hypothetical protein